MGGIALMEKNEKVWRSPAEQRKAAAEKAARQKPKPEVK